MMTPRHFIALPVAPSPVGEQLCRLCAETGLSCCRTEPGLTHLSFPLSLPEWRVLAPYAAFATQTICDPPHTGEGRESNTNPVRLSSKARVMERNGSVSRAVPRKDDPMCAYEPNTPEFIQSMHALFPGKKKTVVRLFPLEGEHMTLRTRAEGACVFLGDQGCRLPREVRPVYCLIFPAWVIDGSLTLFLSKDCRISQAARGPAHGVELLGEEPAHIRRLHSRLCREWGLDAL